MGILGICSCVLVFSFTLFGTNADKNPTGIPFGYPEYTQSYYKKPASYYRKCIPQSNQDVQTLPDRNGGRPFHNCRYTISSLEGLFFRSNGTYYPCKKPEVLGIVRVGEIFPKSLQVVKGVHEVVATKYPLPIPEATGGRPTSVPVSGGIVTDAFIFLKNTSVPYQWEKDEYFQAAIQDKIKIIKENSRLYRDTQLELLLSLHEGLSNTVDNSEQITHNFNQNRNQNDRRDSAPLIVTDFQTFGTPTTRNLEDLLNDDYVKAERTFGLAGTRFEFQNTKNVSERMLKLTNSKVKHIDIGDLGNSPQDASRNTVNMHQSFIDLCRRIQLDMNDHLSEQAGSILLNSQFNFKVSSTIPVPFCNEDIEVDPAGTTPAGSATALTGMGK